MYYSHKSEYIVNFSSAKSRSRKRRELKKAFDSIYFYILIIYEIILLIYLEYWSRQPLV